MTFTSTFYLNGNPIEINGETKLKGLSSAQEGQLVFVPGKGNARVESIAFDLVKKEMKIILVES